MDTDEFADVDEQLARVLRHIGTLPNGKGREVAWLAQKIKTTVQVVNNWKIRGIPGARQLEVAKAVGWSAEQLSGGTAPPAAWPFDMISQGRLAALTERQLGMIERAVLLELERIEAASGKLRPDAA
jgi:hypothetical protein